MNICECCKFNGMLNKKKENTNIVYGIKRNKFYINNNVIITLRIIQLVILR